MEAFPLANSSNPLYCDTSTGTQQPLVPLDWRRTVLDSFHGLFHPGIRATQKLVTAGFIWHGKNTDVCCWAHLCIKCQHAKIQRFSHTPLSSLPVPDSHFDVIHIHLVGPLPTVRGLTYLLTYVDHFTRWPEVFSVLHITKEKVAQAFLSGLISLFGVPSTIVTDHGHQFEFKL